MNNVDIQRTSSDDQKNQEREQMSEERKMNIEDEQLEEVTGGGSHEGAVMQKVYTIDGGPINMWNPGFPKDPFWRVPNRTEMKVDPAIQRQEGIWDMEGYDFYWACHERRWLII